VPDAEGPPLDAAEGGHMTTPDYDTEVYTWTLAQVLDEDFWPAA
jgi:hypothetical protein